MAGPRPTTAGEVGGVQNTPCSALSCLASMFRSRRWGGARAPSALLGARHVSRCSMIRGFRNTRQRPLSRPPRAVVGERVHWRQCLHTKVFSDQAPLEKTARSPSRPPFGQLPKSSVIKPHLCNSSLHVQPVPSPDLAVYRRAATSRERGLGNHNRGTAWTIAWTPWLLFRQS